MIRRLLLAAVITGATVVVAAPSPADADAVCAWVDPHGVCIGNPLGNVPRLPLPL